MMDRQEQLTKYRCGKRETNMAQTVTGEELVLATMDVQTCFHQLMENCINSNILNGNMAIVRGEKVLL